MAGKAVREVIPSLRKIEEFKPWENKDPGAGEMESILKILPQQQANKMAQWQQEMEEAQKNQQGWFQVIQRHEVRTGGMLKMQLQQEETHKTAEADQIDHGSETRGVSARGECVERA